MNVSEIKVSFKPRIKANERTTVRSAREAYRVFLEQWSTDLIEYQEEFKIMLLNNANKVLGIIDLAKGAMDSVQVDLKILFAIALKASAKKIILAHNHPSGNLEPSRADKAITSRVVQVGQILDIAICDHLIITSQDYYSFADNGEI